MLVAFGTLATLSRLMATMFLCRGDIDCERAQYGEINFIVSAIAYSILHQTIAEVVGLIFPIVGSITKLYQSFETAGCVVLSVMSLYRAYIQTRDTHNHVYIGNEILMIISKLVVTCLVVACPYLISGQYFTNLHRPVRKLMPFDKKILKIYRGVYATQQVKGYASYMHARETLCRMMHDLRLNDPRYRRLRREDIAKHADWITPHVFIPSKTELLAMEQVNGGMYEYVTGIKTVAQKRIEKLLSVFQ